MASKYSSHDDLAKPSEGKGKVCVQFILDLLDTFYNTIEAEKMRIDMCIRVIFKIKNHEFIYLV